MRWHDTATILRGVAVSDPYTGEAGGIDWSSPTPQTTPCSIQPRTSTEPGTDREIVVGGWMGYFPAGTDLLSSDRISWRGRTLTVDGDVAPWVRDGAVHHLEAPLQEVS